MTVSTLNYAGQNPLDRVHDALNALWGRARLWRQSKAANPSRTIARAAHVQIPAARLSDEAQWAKISNLVLDAGTRSSNAAALQQDALQQLDLAQYGIITLRDELSAVMNVPSRRNSPVVPLFADVPPETQSRALAA